MYAEPFGTGVVFATFAALVLLSVLLTRGFERTNLPVTLLFLAIGIMAGSEGVGGIMFDDFGIAFRIGTAALVLILFDGGLNTPMESFKRVWAPAGLLATIGVAAVALATAGGAWLLGVDWPQALLFGAIVSSTDAAAVFLALRNSGIGLRRKVGTTLEVESGLNDPMAVILTIAVTGMLVRGEQIAIGQLALEVLQQLGIGAILGYGFGRVARNVLTRVRLRALGLYPVLTLAVAMLAFGLTTVLQGSGFLAVYVAGVVMGNGPLPYRAGVVRTHDASAWLSQIVMFLVFGLLVYPSQLGEVAGLGLSLAFVLVFLARPLVVALFLKPFGYSWREIGYSGWIGLRGAVPIVLSIFPVLAGAPGAMTVFNVVFFVVVVNAVLPGATVAWATKRFGMDVDEPPRPHALLELESMEPLRGELMTFYVDEALAVAGATLSELPFPEGAAAALIIRGSEMVPPKGSTALMPGDYVYVFARPEDRHFMQLMFGRPEE